MLISLLILCIAGIIFVITPLKAVFTMAALMAIWIEWSFPQIFGIRLGLLDVAIIGGLLGVYFSSGAKQETQQTPFKSWIVAYILICLLSFLYNSFLIGIDIPRLIWGGYKTIYITLSFFLFYALLIDKINIQKAIGFLILSSTIRYIMGCIIWFSCARAWASSNTISPSFWRSTS